jgi:hypothetical protein
LGRKDRSRDTRGGSPRQAIFATKLHTKLQLFEMPSDRTDLKFGWIEARGSGRSSAHRETYLLKADAHVSLLRVKSDRPKFHADRELAGRSTRSRVMTPVPRGWRSHAASGKQLSGRAVDPRSQRPSAIAEADALKSALRLLPAQILLELAQVIERAAALPAQALELALRSTVICAARGWHCPHCSFAGIH